VAFKVKSNHPRRWSVAPSSGIIAGTASTMIMMTMTVGDAEELSAEFKNGIALEEDKLLILTTFFSGNEETLLQVWTDQTSRHLTSSIIPVVYSFPGLKAASRFDNYATRLDRSIDTVRCSAFEALALSPLVDAPVDLDTARSQFQQMISAAIILTAQRDRLRRELKDSSEKIKKLTEAETPSEEVISAFGFFGGSFNWYFRARQVSTEIGPSLPQIAVVASLCFFLGRYFSLRGGV
jgi:hypothetical protein